MRNLNLFLKIRKTLQVYFFVIIIYYLPISLFSQNLLNHPESVVFDELHNRYLVTSNGNGLIVSIDMAGNQTTFKSGLPNILGSYLKNNTIYVSYNNNVKGFDLTDSSEVFHANMLGIGWLDGLTIDNSGNLYVIDVSMRRIYRINLITDNYNIFVNSGLPTYPQDCIFDEENNRLLVVAWANNAPIQAVSLFDSTVSTVVSTTFGLFDGITNDQFGNVYVSSHYGTENIYMYDKNFTNPPELISSGHSEPAGLGYNTRDNILAVPNYGSHTIDYIQITPNSIYEDRERFADMFELFQNYPNPFNPTTTISYYLPEAETVNLKIVNLKGQIVKTLELNTRKSKGHYSMVWDGTNDLNNKISTGCYLYRLETGNTSKTKRMIYLK